MLGMCIMHVYAQVSSVSLLPSLNLSGGLDKLFTLLELDNHF